MEFISSLHPVAVHFPIAISIVYTILEFFALIKNEKTYYFFSLLLLLFAITGGVVSVLSGNQAMHVLIEQSGLVTGEFKDILELHESYANYFLWFFIFFAVFRVYLQISGKIFLKIRYILMILLVLGVFLTYETGRLGGILVYKYGAGTGLILDK